MRTTNLYFLSLLFIMGIVICATSCKDEDEPMQAPIIKLDNPTATYTVKIGNSLKVEPLFENTEAAIYAWKTEGKIVSTEPVLDFEATALGDNYFTIEVITEAGNAYAEIKISVIDKWIPSININMPDDGFMVIKGGELELTPLIVTDSTQATSYQWTVNGEKVADTKTYSFSENEIGTYNVNFACLNEDGSDDVSFVVKVLNAEDLPFKWVFESDTMNLSKGRTIKIVAYGIENAFDASFSWTVDGIEKHQGSEPYFEFNGQDEGEHTIIVSMKNSYTTITKKLIVNVCPPEGTYKRTATASSQSSWNKVYEFLAAPGQFVNEGYNATTMSEAIQYAEGRLNSKLYVSLGGFGGYIVVGFDHSIENDNAYNIQVIGNSFAGSSEPGIVWVMQDENGDGLPNDTWYELKGSETDKGTVISDYELTYYKPSAPAMPVQWTDNQGKTGTIDYLGSFHRQEYYYPLWATNNTLTFRGTCLPASNKETTPGVWYNGDLDWGYADNFSNIDRLTDDDNYAAAANANHFKISNAIKYDGSPINLQYIDFVKVSTGVNCKSGWLGECSTEVFGINDFNLLKKK